MYSYFKAGPVPEQVKKTGHFIHSDLGSCKQCVRKQYWRLECVLALRLQPYCQFTHLYIVAANGTRIQGRSQLRGQSAQNTDCTGRGSCSRKNEFPRLFESERLGKGLVWTHSRVMRQFRGQRLDRDVLRRNSAVPQ